jgi:hypothetical protein
MLVIEDGDRLYWLTPEWEISNQRNFLVIIPCGDIPWINRLKHGFQDDVTDVLWHIYFIVVEVYNGTRIKQAMNPFKNAKFWSNDSHWNGQQNQIREKASFVWKYFADARKGNLILSKDEGDYLSNQN